MPRGVTRAAYPRVLLCDSLRCRRGSAFAFANLLGEPGRLSPPIWPCTTRGFPGSRYCYRDGGLLPHLFTLAKRSSLSGRLSPDSLEDVSQVSLRDATVLLRRRYILCGTFRN